MWTGGKHLTVLCVDHVAFGQELASLLDVSSESLWIGTLVSRQIPLRYNVRTSLLVRIN